MSPTEKITLAAFNSASTQSALSHITHWCAAPQWAEKVSSARPYESIEQLQATAEQMWQAADDAQCLEAFAAHPAIGDVELLRSKYAAQANAEQGQVLDADDSVIEALAMQNLSYNSRHGFTFIVFATGKSAAQMLELLNQRIGNTRSEEIHNAKIEQLKIMQLRLQQTFDLSANAKTNPEHHAH